MEDKEFTFAIPESIKQMEKEMAKDDIKAEKANLEKIKDKNKKAMDILKKLSKPIVAKIEDIVFTLNPITVAIWDFVEGNKDDPASQTIIVRECLQSPELSEKEFDILPAAIKYKLFMYLLQDFFSMAAKMERNISS